MEHYILCISLETNIEENHCLLNSYLASLVPSNLQYQCSLHFASQLSFLLKCNNLYIKTLSRTQTQNVEWQGPVTDLNIKKMRHEEFTQNLVSEDTLEDHYEQICESIHMLADLLPAFGTYKLDVLLSSNVLKDRTVSDEPMLASAFYRLMRWHAAHFAIYIESEVDKSKFDEWCEIINADILNENNEINFGPSIWRGSILLQDPQDSENISLEGLELKLNSKENQDILSILECLNEDNRLEKVDHVVLSDKMHVIDQCSFSSIPPHMVSPMVFQLHVCQRNLLNESSSDFINYLLSNDEATLITRLRYARIKERAKSEKKYCTNRWKKAVSVACIKTANTYISTYEEYITFAVTKSKHTDHVIAYPLREANSLNPSFYFNLINNKSFIVSSKNAERKSKMDAHTSILSDVPLIHNSLFSEVVQTMKNLNLELFKNCGNFTYSSKIKEKLSALWESIRNLSKKHNLSGIADSSNVLLEEIDPSDWPERVYLLWKQIQLEEEKKGTAPNALLGLGPKLPVQCVSFTSEDIKRYFLSSGETKNPSNIEVILPLNNLNLSTSDLEMVINSKWPAAVQHLYHDLYYNSSLQAEEKETMGNQMVNFYVKYETASTCNKQQINQNLPIVIQTKNSPSTKEFRSPSLRKPTNTINKSTEEKENKDCKENIVRDLITKKILSTSRNTCSQNVNKIDAKNTTKVATQSSSKKGVKRKCDAPIRCSPRKKVPVTYNYPSKRNSESSKNAKISKSNEQLVLLKKKLRHAVATALENQGIHLKHAFFQPCGKKLFTICQAFVQDIPQKGKTSEHLQRIADAHVKQVIEFEKQKHEK